MNTLNLAFIAAAVLLLQLLASPAAAQTIYRCTDTEGKIALQQVPCAPGRGGAVAVSPTNVVESEPAGEAGLRAQVSRQRIGGSGLQRGMTDAEVFRVLGRPTVVNSDYVNGRVSNQYVYRYPDGSAQYVYVNDEGLYAVQSRPATSHARQQAPCYTALELRNAEVGMNSTTLPPEERARRKARVDEMRRCSR